MLLPLLLLLYCVILPCSMVSAYWLTAVLQGCWPDNVGYTINQETTAESSHNHGIQTEADLGMFSKFSMFGRTKGDSQMRACTTAARHFLACRTSFKLFVTRCGI